MKYHEWYIQTVGALIGLIICIYSYLKGNLILFNNIALFKDLSIITIIASYTIYPLCILVLLLSTLKLLLDEKFNSKLVYIYKLTNYLTVIVGILGCKFLFIIPSLFILYIPIRESIYLLKNKKENENNKNTDKNYTDNFVEEVTLNLNEVKVQMAQSLLNNNADLGFIREVTGLNQNEINSLKKNQQQ